MCPYAGFTLYKDAMVNKIYKGLEPSSLVISENRQIINN